MNHRDPLSAKTLSIVALVILTVAVVGPAAGQIPEERKNLQVLPKDISQEELVSGMRFFTRALGVRCQHCHVGEEGQPLSTFDFASDEKATKKTARVMMRMTREINSKLLPQVGKTSAELLEVDCATCHHGQARPQSIEQVLTATLEEEGIDAMIARYRELRERYYGRYTFDFSEWTLRNLAEEVAEGGDLDASLKLLELNFELYPDSGWNYVYLGDYHARKGDKEQAIVNFKKGIELLPRMAARLEAKIAELEGEETSIGVR